jgi:hypothetical protein
MTSTEEQFLSFVNELTQQDSESKSKWKERLIGLAKQHDIEDEDRLWRSPTYTVVELLKQYAERTYGFSTEDGDDESDSESSSGFLDNFLVTQSQDPPTPRCMNMSKSGDQDGVDAETVVDMSFVTNTKTPLEENMARFHQLITMYGLTSQAIETNSTILESYKDKLDEKDLSVFQHYVEDAKENVLLIRREMHEIYRCTIDMQKDKQLAYEDLVTHWKGDTRKIREYAMNRIQELDSYIQFMNQHVETSDVSEPIEQDLDAGCSLENSGSAST